MVDVRLTLKHDKGTVRIQTTASTVWAGIELLLRAELAPPSAIKKVEYREIRTERWKTAKFYRRN